MANHETVPANDGEIDYAKSDLAQLRHAVEGLARAREVLRTTLGGFSPDDLLNIARRGAIEEPKNLDPKYRSIVTELVFASDTLACALVEKIDSGKRPNLAAVRRASRTLTDIWNGDPETLTVSNELHLEYIRGEG